MLVKSARYTLDTKSRPARRRSRWFYYLFPEIGLSGFCIIAISFVVLFSDASLRYVFLSMNASLYSMSGAVPGVIFFMLIQALIVLSFIFILGRRWSQPILFIVFLVAVFGCLLLANSIPVVMYAEMVDEKFLGDNDWPIQIGVAISLLTANGMLLFFTHTMYASIWNELRQNYVVASRFRAGNENKTLKEKIKWIYFAQITPVFYFMFSFTLFTDIVFQDETDEQGIVKTLFEKVTQDGFEENIGRITVYGLTMLVVILIARIFTSFPLRAWEARHGVIQS